MAVKNPTPRACGYPGCGRKHESRGYCKTHANMDRKGIELHPIGKPAHLRSGSENPVWRGQDITYVSAHQRVHRALGKATNHECVDCGFQAHEWSYIGGDPNERVDPRNRAYSADPDFYRPRCRRDHRHFDHYQRTVAA